MERTLLPEKLWNSPVIQQRLLQEAMFDCRYGVPEKAYFDLIVPEADARSGQINLRNYAPSLGEPAPHPIQVQFAKNLQDVLMREANFDGLWIVGWTHPPTKYAVLTEMDNAWQRLVLIWLDADGDPQYTIDYDKPVIQIISDGIDLHAQKAVDAHDQWREIYGHDVMKDDMMLTEDQVSKKALESLKKGSSNVH